MTGVGASYARACNLEHLLYEYLTTSQLFYGEQTASTSYTTTVDYSATVTTLCDGHERVVGSLTPMATGTNSTVFEVAVTSPIPSPTCVVSPDDYQTYVEDAWSSAYFATNSTITVHLGQDLAAMVTGSAGGGSSTISLADRPDETPPPLIIGGTTYAANNGPTYYIQIWPESFDPLTPGDSVTVTQFVPAAYAMPQYDASSQTRTTAIEVNITESQASATSFSANSTASEDCPCTIAGKNVRLLYYPVTTSASQKLCQTSLAQGTFCPHGPDAITINAQNSVSIDIELQVDQGTACPIKYNNYTKSTNSGPYAVSAGTTFYENRAYLAFDVLSATRQCGYRGGVGGQLTSDTLATTVFVGNEYSNSVIEIPSTDLYSGCGYSYFYDAVGYSVNWAEFNQPVPASAFLCQPACYEAVAYPMDVYKYGDTLNGKLADPAFCNVILESEYKPQLLIPPQARTIDPAWSTCVLKLNGLLDPPKALTAQTSAEGPAAPTPNAGMTSSAPSPASTPISPSASQTSAIADQTPTTTPVAGAGTASQASPAVDGPSSPTDPDPDAPPTYNVAESPAIAVSQSALDQPTIVANTAQPEQVSEAPLSITFAGSVYVASSTGGSVVVVAASGDPSQGDPSQANATQDGPLQPDPAAATTIAAFGNPATAAVDLANTTPGAVNDPILTSFDVSEQIVAASQDPSNPSIVNIGSTRVTAGGSAVTINGNPVSLGSSGLVIGGAASSALATNIGDQVVAATQQANGQSAVVIDGTTLSSGGNDVTISGTVVSAVSGGVVIGGTQTVPLNTGSTGGVSSDAIVTNIGGQPVAAAQLANGQSAVIIDGITLSPGGDDATISGTIVSAASGSIVVGGTQTISLSAGSTQQASDAAVLTLGTRTITAVAVFGSGHAVAISGTILSPGGSQVTIDGTVLSAGSRGLVVGGTGTTLFSLVPGVPSNRGPTSQGNAVGPRASASTTSAALGRAHVALCSLTGIILSALLLAIVL